MDLGELPMILFTVITQMCVGMFVVLGVVQLIGSTRYSARAVDRLADPALLAIGPAMILGLLVSMLHMNDIGNMFNVIRHFQTSWLSREILFGVGFAAFGFLFCIMQILKIGGVRVRQLVALVTAALGIGLVISQVQIYYSLPTVPAWSSWFTWVQFFGTALMLGSLVVATTFVLIIFRRENRIGAMSEAEIAALEEPHEKGSIMTQFSDFVSDKYIVNKATRDEVDRLFTGAVRLMVAVAIVTAGVLLIATPLYVSSLASMGEAGMASAAHYAGGLAALRFTLLLVGALVFGLAAFYAAGYGVKRLKLLLFLLVSSFLLVLISEFVGRTLFYEAMTRVGV